MTARHVYSQLKIESEWCLSLLGSGRWRDEDSRFTGLPVVSLFLPSSVRDKGRLFPKASRNWLYPEELRQSTFSKPPSPYTAEHYANERFFLAAESPLVRFAIVGELRYTAFLQVSVFFSWSAATGVLGSLAYLQFL